MAYVRQPSTNYATNTSLSVLVDGLQYNPNEYYNITLYCLLNGRIIDSKRVDETGAGGIGNYRTQTYIFTGLTPGTTYEFYAEARHYSYSTIVLIGRANGDTTPAKFTTTGSAGPLIPDTPNAYFDSVDGRTITIRIVTGANTQGIQIDYPWTSYTVDASTSMSSYSTYYHTVTVPSYGTTYTIKVRAYNGTEYSYWDPVNVTSEAAPIVVGQVTGLTAAGFASDSITLSWNHASNAWYYQIQRSVNGYSWVTVTSYATSSTYTVSGLDPTTTYYFRVRGWQQETYGSYSSTLTARTLSNQPTAFQWNTLKYAGDPATNLAAYEWNALCSRINQWRTFKGFPTYSFTTATTGGIFYAYMFNEARDAIATLNPPTNPPGAVSKGDELTAYRLNLLRNSLNSLIS